MSKLYPPVHRSAFYLMIGGEQCVQIADYCCYSVQFVQIVQLLQIVPTDNLMHSSTRPATGNQPKIDIDPPPLVSPHRWTLPLPPRYSAEQKYSEITGKTEKPDI